MARVKRKKSQGRAGLPFYRVTTAFFSLWDAIAWIWNSILYMQLNDLKTLQFQIVWVPRNAFFFILIQWQSYLIVVSFSETATSIAIFNKQKKMGGVRMNFLRNHHKLSSSFYKDGTSLTLFILKINTEQQVFWENAHTIILSK